MVDVGAGAGSYEARDRWVLAIEPSATMRGQRPVDAAPAIAARAESLPLDDDAVDAAMACVTIHHWEPPEAGLAEMRRIARSRIVVFTFERDCLPAWQQDYLAEASRSSDRSSSRWKPSPTGSSSASSTASATISRQERGMPNMEVCAT